MSEEITKEIDLSGFDFDSIELNGVEYDTNGNPINPQQSDVAKVFQETEVPKAESTAVEAVELNKITYPVRDVEEAQTREEAIRNVNAEIAVLEENIANTVARLNEIKAELEGSISDVDTKVTSLETSVGNIETNIETIEEDLDTVGTAVDTIETKIPSQSSASNQLADKDFVNSSIATNTANFIGTFNTLQELEAQSATNNDYAFWKTTDSDNNIVYKRYKYVADDDTWQYEYDLNNSSFTAEQWASIQSGITSDLVSSYSSHIDNKSNPHGVTKAQVGLGNVNNTSDANKPVSTATQTALDGKQSKVAKLGSTSKPVYTSAEGTFAECSSYAGGTAVTLNGTSKGATTASLYAPTSAGTAGQILKSEGTNKAPTWTDAPTSSVTSVAGKTGAVTLTASDVGLGNVANSTYAGGTAVTLNGTSKGASTASFYAPTASGTSGQVLKSGGANTAPSWSNADFTAQQVVDLKTLLNLGIRAY